MTGLHPVLRLIYFLLRAFAWLSGQIFYRHRIVLGRDNLRDFDGPAIVVSNHPSTLMDVLNVGVPIPREMFFLANYGLFKNPVSNWILTRLFCIPIKRKEDVGEGDSRNNDSAFEQSYRHLEKKGILFIAPEGYSWMNRWVREFKTGTARIAFGAENRNDWQLGLKIYPVGLTYSAANLFRSQVVINYGAPLDVRAWAPAWQQHRVKAVDALTTELQQRVTDLTVHTGDETGQDYLEKLDEIVAHARPLAPAAGFRRSQELAARHRDDASLRQEVETYFANLHRAGLSDRGLEKEASGGGNTFFQAFFLVLGFPLFAAGYVFWAPPCFLPWLLANRPKLYVGYQSTVKILAAALVFPLWFWSVYRLAFHFSGQAGRSWAVILAGVALGFFIERYADVFRQFRQQQKAVFFARKHPEAWTKLNRQRAAILATLAKKDQETIADGYPNRTTTA